MPNSQHDYQSLYRMLVGELGDYAIFLMDTEGRLTTWNFGVERLLGYREDEFVGHPVSMLFTPEDIAQRAPEIERETAARDARAPDVRWHIRKDGSRLFVDGVLTAVFDSSKRLVGFSKVMHDITEQRRAEHEREQLLAQLRDQNERIKTMLESVGDAFYAVDAEFRLTYVNQHAVELWRKTGEELRGRCLWDEFPAVVGSESHRKHLQVMADRQPAHFETISMATGNWVDISLYPDSQGGLCCYFRDISQRKRIEEALQASEERFRAAFAHAPIGMVLTTVDGLLVETNQAYRELTGYDSGELAQITFLDLSHPDDRPRNRKLYQQLLRGDISSYTIEKRYVCKDGRLVWARATAALRRDSLGRPVEVVGLVENIDERKTAESERERLLLELARSNEELARFAHVVSHDLQAPVRMVRSFAQLLARRYGSQLDATAGEYIDIITEGADTMDQLIRALLQYAQLGESTPETETISVSDLLDSVLTTLGPQIAETNALIVREALPGTVRGNRILLHQLFQNLITNALKYRRPEVPPCIQIGSEEHPESWRFFVKDNGPGIPSEHYEKVFEPMKRLHGKEIPGTGIGLAICRRIAERHGGRIWVESQPGEGATFRFTLKMTTATDDL